MEGKTKGRVGGRERKGKREGGEEKKARTKRRKGWAD